MKVTLINYQLSQAGFVSVQVLQLDSAGAFAGLGGAGDAMIG